MPQTACHGVHRPPVEGELEFEVDDETVRLAPASRCTSAPTGRTAGAIPDGGPPAPSGWRSAPMWPGPRTWG